MKWLKLDDTHVLNVTNVIVNVVRSHHKSYHNQAAEYPGTNPELLVTAVTATRNRPGCPPRYILANLAIKSTILVT